MRVSRPLRTVNRHGLLVAALAVFALFIQALIPGASIAHEAAMGSGFSLVICTGEGAKTVTLPGEPSPEKNSLLGHHCGDCVIAGHTLADSPAAQPIAPVAYAAAPLAFTPGRDWAPAQARPPPRPPGQGPPPNA